MEDEEIEDVEMDYRICHRDFTDEYHDCYDYIECDYCPYYYEDDEEQWF